MAYNTVIEDIEKTLEFPEFIHANDLDTLPIAIFISLITDSKLIYDAHELYPERFSSKWDRLILSIQEFFLIRFVDKISVVNEFIAKVMSKRYKIKISKVVLNTPPKVSSSNVKSLTIREKLKIKKEIPIILYSGALIQGRGIENTILALKYLKKIILVIMGEGELKEVLIRLSREEGLEKRIFFTEPVFHLEVPRYISSATIGIIPNKKVSLNNYLCSPSKLFHYIMGNLPIVGSDFPFLRRIILDNEIGWVFDPNSPRSIAHAIDYVLSNEKRYRRMKENLLITKEKYNWEREAKKFLSLFSDVWVSK
jgi:glycosyltransferase involved in cell wall biosynthesis